MTLANGRVKLVLPKGRQASEVFALFAEAGIHIASASSGYRPACSDARFEVKLLKAANIPKLVEYGAHDVGVTGLDWIRETDSQVEELLDTGLLPVRVVSAAPAGVDPFAGSSSQPLTVASEYENLTRSYMTDRCADFRYVRTFGATEVFPPEDADMIVDNTASGSTLRGNGLDIIDEILRSSTRVIACRKAMEDPVKRTTIDEMVLLLDSVLQGRRRVLLDMNVAPDRLDAVVALLPSMKSPTIQRLHGEGGYAVRVAVLREEAPGLLPAIRRAGATDILQTSIQRAIA